MKKCYDIGLHLPDTQTLATIAGSLLGRSDIAAGDIVCASGNGANFYGNCDDNCDICAIGRDYDSGIAETELANDILYSGYEDDSYTYIFEATYYDGFSAITIGLATRYVSAGALCVGD